MSTQQWCSDLTLTAAVSRHQPEPHPSPVATGGGVMTMIQIRVTQADRVAVLLDALGEIPLSAAERASLGWLAGQDLTVVESLAAMISRARGVCLWCTTSPAPHQVGGDPVCEGCYRDHRTEVIL